MIEVKFLKKHPDARLPVRKHEPVYNGIKDKDGNPWTPLWIESSGDTGYDVCSVEDVIIPAKGSKVVDTGIDIAYIQPGYWFKIEARSGLGFKHGIQPHPGIVDNCVPKGTIIKTVEGDILVEDLYSKNNVPYIFSYNEEKCDKEIDSIKEMWTVQNQEMLEIETENGDILQLPPTKLILTKTGWKKAQDLRDTDYVLTF